VTSWDESQHIGPLLIRHQAPTSSIQNECNYTHSTETPRAYEGIYFPSKNGGQAPIFFQSRPISPESLAGQFRSFDLEALDRFKKAGDFIVGACLFSFSTRNRVIFYDAYNK
jgi:hypothetical protein